MWRFVLSTINTVTIGWSRCGRTELLDIQGSNKNKSQNAGMIRKQGIDCCKYYNYLLVFHFLQSYNVQKVEFSISFDNSGM